MIEPIGILLLDVGNDEDVGILLGDEHDDVEFRFIMLVGSQTGETLRFQPSDNMTVEEFFEALDEPGNASEPEILKFLKVQRSAAVLVAFDGEPRTFDLDDL
ncbi:hypothetical protein JJB09_05820 [Rhizobium sp. KVB221]|uniref:Uncharacterized protein n=1 Tax=Rhizobium setariae TaxID=2801340 RepID=A0A936YNU3_9HYPH|nr:hypothetical protein [Rhizobium setariae]MBL0371539.1 hypothetical protein [Rhizobium setariae]